MRKYFNIEELKNASNRVFYEYWMMKIIQEIYLSGFPYNLIITETSTHAPSSLIISRSTVLTNLPEIIIDDTVKIKALNNGIVESFGVHYRALLDFFYKIPREDDDIMAVHYFTTPLNWTIIPPKIDLRKKKERVNKEIVHITNTYGKEKLDWPFASLLHEVEELIEMFTNNVAKIYLGDRWR